jgi:hypothetical protein
MHVNSRAIIERDAPSGREILIQTRDKPFEGGRWFELPGGRVAGVRDTQVECLKPFAVFQTIQGPVVSLGFHSCKTISNLPISVEDGIYR